MRAITQKSVGGPEVLEIIERPVPVPGPGQVLVRIKAAGINPVDAAVRAGYFPLLGEPPFTVGWDISGVVVTAAGRLLRWRRGVWNAFLSKTGRGLCRTDRRSRFRACAQTQRSRSRPGSGLAACRPHTAWQGLAGAGRLQQGQRVLIHAGAGGVGHLAVQIAKARGAYVIATASPGKLDFVRSLGADEAIDYKAEDFVAFARDIDIVLDPIGGEHVLRSLQTLRSGGVLVALLDPSDHARSEASSRGIRLDRISVSPDRDGLVELIRLVDAGKLAVHVAKTFPLDQAAAAHAYLGTKPMGKVVLTM